MSAEPLESLAGEVREGKPALGSVYRAYLEGRRALALAFKEREYQDQEAYKDAERRYHLCEEAIEKALRTREKAEEDASDTYSDDIDKAVDRASQTYKDKVRQTLIECKQRVMDVWKSSSENSPEMTGVCEEEIEKAMKAREKADMDALLAYRQEVDKAIDKASQAYRDKLRLTLHDCKQRVMDAWKSSMETSAEMTGIFEDDRIVNTEYRATGRKPENNDRRVREFAVGLRSRFLAFTRKAMRALEVKRFT